MARNDIRLKYSFSVKDALNEKIKMPGRWQNEYSWINPRMFNLPPA